MRLATIRRAGTTHAVRIDDDWAKVLPYESVTAMLLDPDWKNRASAADNGEKLAEAELDFAALVTPQKVICVGLNYKSHILEMGRELPSYPTLFTKFQDTLIGANDDLVLPAESTSIDWEAELGVVVGSVVRRADEKEAGQAIAGYTVVNDISMRDWQWQTTQWTAGKNFEGSTPVGPVLVTSEEVGDAEDLELTCTVDGVVMQSARTSDLLFSPAAIVSYISQFTTLHPGDLIATGTPAGVAAGRKPERFLQAGQTVRVNIEGIGACTNKCIHDGR